MSLTTMRSFLPIEKLGEGSFASVYKVQRISDRKIYALKKVQSLQFRSRWLDYHEKLGRTLSTKYGSLPLLIRLISPNTMKPSSIRIWMCCAS